MEKKTIALLVAIVALAIAAICIPLTEDGQAADSDAHVGDEVTISIPTVGCKDVKSGLIQFEYDGSFLGFVSGSWTIDALMKDVSDGEGVFAVAGTVSIPAKDDLVELRFQCKSVGQITIDVKLTFKTSAGEITEQTEIAFAVSCDHDLVKHPATPATTEKEGSTLYYSCSKCGKYYSDANGLKEIEEGSWIIPKIDPSGGLQVTVNFVCDGKQIADPVVRQFASAGSAYDLAIGIDGYEQTGEVKMSGSPSGLIMTYGYQKLEQADSVRVYAGQEGSNASIAIIADDGIVPDGKLHLNLAYTYRESGHGLLVSAYDYVDLQVTGGDGTVIVLEDLSDREHYGTYFSLSATFMSSDGKVNASSSRIAFNPE